MRDISSDIFISLRHLYLTHTYSCHTLSYGTILLRYDVIKILKKLYFAYMLHCDYLKLSTQ